MEHQTPTTPDTKAGTSNSSTKKIRAVRNQATSDDLQTFLDNLQLAPAMPDREDGMPVVETTRDVIEYYNRDVQSMKSFDSVGYFILQGVKVKEAGKQKKAE